MDKTTKESRSDFAKEMRDKKRESDEQLQQVDTLPISEELKEQKRQEIMDNFAKEIEEIKNRPGYKQAEGAHVYNLRLRAGQLKLTKNVREIIHNIRAKHVKVEENEKWKGKIFHIQLPPIYNRYPGYPGFTFEGFIPDEHLNITGFMRKVDQKKLYTRDEIERLYRNITDYIKEAYIDKYGYQEYLENANFRGQLPIYQMIWPFNNGIYWLKDEDNSEREWEKKHVIRMPGKRPANVNKINKVWTGEGDKYLDVRVNALQPIYKLH